MPPSAAYLPCTRTAYTHGLSTRPCRPRPLRYRLPAHRVRLS